MGLSRGAIPLTSSGGLVGYPDRTPFGVLLVCRGYSLNGTKRFSAAKVFNQEHDNYKQNTHYCDGSSYSPGKRRSLVAVIT